MGDRGGDWKQCQGLPLELGLSARRLRRRCVGARCLCRRLKVDGARCTAKRRHRGGGCRGYRWGAALRRPQQQHTGTDETGPGVAKPRTARFRAGCSLNEGRMRMKKANFHGYHIRKMATLVEDTLANESGQLADGEMLRKMVLVAVVQNPYAGQFSRSLGRLVKNSDKLGEEFGRRLTELAGGRKIASNGKACRVGMPGISGSELRCEMLRRGHGIPTILHNCSRRFCLAAA